MCSFHATKEFIEVDDEEWIVVNGGKSISMEETRLNQ